MTEIVTLPESPGQWPSEKLSIKCREIFNRRDEIVGNIGIETAYEAMRRAHAIEKYIRSKDHKNDAIRAARILEAAVGAALGPADRGHDRTRGAKSLAGDIGKDEAYRFRLMAKHREAWWQKIQENAMSRADVLRLIKENEKTTDSHPCNTATASDLSRVIDSGIRFGCITADPPWVYGNQGTRASTGNHYKGMSIDELCEMPINSLCKDDAFLHLWTTNGFLFEAKKIMNAWGFEYKSCFIWAKSQMGIGNYWRVSHEFLLLGKRGAPTWKTRNEKSWAEYPRTKHSVKPEKIIDKIEAACSGPYLELFARRPRKGWVVWGNEINKDVFDSSVREIL